jgi:hypothetical protein
MEESRLIVTGRLPVLEERIVRETRVGCVVVANAVAVTEPRGGFFTTVHFSPVAGTVVAARVLP